MDRRTQCSRRHRISFPHRRGGGPTSSSRTSSMSQFSPQAWGWTAKIARSPALPTFSPQAWGWTAGLPRLEYGDKVFPTGVGVDRRSRTRLFPSAPFSPQAWGWTAAERHFTSQHDVFPTGVGVDRPRMAVEYGWSRFPHRRGGGPAGWSASHCQTVFSPQAWGWTEPTT